MRAAPAARCEISTDGRFGIDTRAADAARSAISTAAGCMIDTARLLRTARVRRLATGAAAAGALAYVALVDPHRASRALPRCPVKLLSGLDCPACGGMRMAYDVAHADPRAALHDNPYLLVCSPLLAVLLWRGSGAPEHGVAMPAPLAYTLAISALAWMLVRNIPGWPLKPLARG